MRTVLAVSLAALAAAPLAAQKPPADAADPREQWRGQGISICVADLASAEEVTPDEKEAICACAFDRHLQNRPTGALPDLEGRFRPLLGSQVFACTLEQAPDRASTVSRWLMAPAPAPIATAAPPPAEEGGKPVETDLGDSPGFDLGAWFDGLSLPARLGDLPRWLWIALGLLAFLLLRFLMRGRDRRDNLMGPPRSMTLGKAVPRRPGPPSAP